MTDYKIDRKNKTFVYDDGEVIPIPKDKVNQVLRTKAGQQSKQTALEGWKAFEKDNPLPESVQDLISSTSKNLFGDIGPTASHYAISGLKALGTEEGQEGLSYREKLLDHFYGFQEGRQDYLNEAQQRSPTASAIGTGLGVGGELALLYGQPASVAFPAMGAGASETSFLEPEEKGKEVVKDVLTGKILDKFFGGLSNVAGQRGNQRNARNLINSTEEANAAELRRVSGLNEADKTRFATENNARNANVQRIGQLQNMENQAFQKASGTAAEKIAQTMGKQSLPNEILGVEDFISKAIDTSAHAATTEGNYASRFLRSIFKGDKSGKITGDSLKRGMKALDQAIIKNEGNIKNLLEDYRGFMIQELPNRLASSHVYEKWIPKVMNGTETVQKTLNGVFESSRKANQIVSKNLNHNLLQGLQQETKKTISDTLQGLKTNFHEIDPAILRKEIAESIRLSPAYEKMMAKVDTMFPYVHNAQVMQQTYPEFANLKTSLVNYPEILAEKVSKNYSKYFPDISLEFAQKGGVTESAFKKAPVTPGIIPPPPPVSPMQNLKPTLQNIPVMPEPQGIMGRLAQGLESVRNTGTRTAMQSMKTNAPAMIAAKMAGVPVGKAAMVGAAGVAGARALTSPNMAGQALRQTLEQGSRGVFVVINQLAEKYPSFNNGIIEDPMERRSLTKEIENISELPIEQKAIFQSKINRGKPLQDRL